MPTLSEQNIARVVEHVEMMAEKYDFTPDEHTAADAVHDSAGLLRIELSDEEVKEATERLLD